jgi:hypothetical protein
MQKLGLEQAILDGVLFKAIDVNRKHKEAKEEQGRTKRRAGRAGALGRQTIQVALRRP